MIRRLRAAAAAILFFLAASAGKAAYSPATTNGWFIVAGRVLTSAQFLTDIWLFNPDATNTVTATLIFHPQVSSGGPAGTPISSGAIIFMPRETKFLADVFLSTLPADGQVGALEWQSDLPLMGGQHSYTVPSGCTGGSFGSFLPAIPASESMTAKQSSKDAVNVLQMFGTNSGDSHYRTQLDVTNTSGVTLPVEVNVIDPTTTDIYGGTQNYSIAPYSLLRVGTILVTVGAPLKDGLRITVAVKETAPLIPTGGILAVATTLDDRSNDSFAFVSQRQSGTIVPVEALPAVVVP